MVDIRYKKGVVLCEQYKGPITGKKYAKIVTDSVPAALDSLGGRSRRVLQDGCPRQNSKVARKTSLQAIDERRSDKNVAKINVSRGKINMLDENVQSQ